jgi:hypothetical protein
VPCGRRYRLSGTVKVCHWLRQCLSKTYRANVPSDNTLAPDRSPREARPFRPQTGGTSTGPPALAEPVALNLTLFRHCHAAGVGRMGRPFGEELARWAENV